MAEEGGRSGKAGAVGIEEGGDLAIEHVGDGARLEASAGDASEERIEIAKGG